MKSKKILVTLLAFALALACASMSWAASVRGMDVIEVDGKIYGLTATETDYVWESSAVVEYDADMNVAKTYELKKDAKKGLNPVNMVHVGGKIYVACMGGTQAKGTYGDIWSIDLATGDVKQAYDFSAKKDEIAEWMIGVDGPVEDNTGSGLGDEGADQIFPKTIAANGSNIVVVCEFNVHDYDTTEMDYYSAALFKATATELDGGTMTMTDLSESIVDFMSAGLTNVGGNDRIVFTSDGTMFANIQNVLGIWKSDGSLVKYVNKTDLGGGTNYAASIVGVADSGNGKPGIALTVFNNNWSSPEYTFYGASLVDSDVVITKLVGAYDNQTSVNIIKDGDATYLMTNTYTYGGKDLDEISVYDAASIKAEPRSLGNALGKNIYKAISLGDHVYYAAFELKDDSKNGEIARMSIAKLFNKETGPAIETPEAPASDTSEYKTDVKEAAAGDVNAIDESSRAEVIAAITGNASAKIAEASFDITSDGATMKTADVRAIISVDSSLVLPTEILDEVRPLPMFKAAVESGKIVVVGIEVSGSDLLATKSADVRLAKLRADGSAAMLTLVTKKSELEDGSFTLYDKANDKYADTIAATGSYVINVAIRDGGANDLDGKADGTVFDPIAAFSATTKEPETRQSSGGACSTGAGIAVALAALAIIRRRTK